MKTQSSFQTALAALDSNNLDAEAVKALRICEAADDLLAALERALMALMGYTHQNGITPSEGAMRGLIAQRPACTPCYAFGGEIILIFVLTLF